MCPFCDTEKSSMPLVDVLRSEKGNVQMGWDTEGKNISLDGRQIQKINQARSRLYRSQLLQVNTRWKALAEIYTMHLSRTPLHRSLISKFSLKIAEVFADFETNFARILLNLAEFC